MDYFDSLMSECKTNEALQVAEIRVDIRPIGKERPRDNWHTPEKSRHWESVVRGTARSIMDGRPAINFPVAARYITGISYRNRADIDNIEKIIWDALQPIVLTDDKYVRGYVEKGEKLVEPGHEFVWVRFYARAAQDYSNYIAQCDAISHEEPQF